MKIYTQNLNSSAISKVAWDPEYNILYVFFPSKSAWIYHNVDYDTYRALTHANSAGNYFNKNIRNNKFYPGQKVFQPLEKVDYAHAQ